MTNVKFRLSNIWHLLATGFGSGLLPKVPGTFGSLAALPFGILFYYYLPIWVFILLIIISTIVGIIICQKTTDDIGVEDHGSIVWDEFVGMWITMLAIPHLSWQWLLLAFLLFRLLDMTKPWPISWFDQHISGGLGIMLDDIVAGIISAVVIIGITYIY